MSIPDETLDRWAGLPRPSVPGPWDNFGDLIAVPEVDIAQDPYEERPLRETWPFAEFLAAAPEMREAIDALVAEVRRLRVSMGMALQAAESDMPGSAASTLRAGLR